MARKSLSEILGGRTVFGSYTVLGDGSPDPKNRRVLCRCSCGVEREVDAGKLRSGRSTCCKSCAAKSPDRITNLRHGMSKSSEYSAYRSMIKRCKNPEYHNYKDYGARGINVCSRWQESFESFINDMGLKPSREHSIDRVDNDGNYEPGNCRWALPVEQQANRRVTRKVVFGGEEVPVSILEKQAGLAKGVLSSRLDMGWSLERALSEPGRIKRPKYFVFGEEMSTKQICERFGIQRQSFNMRLRQGWSAEDAVIHYRTL